MDGPRYDALDADGSAQDGDGTLTGPELSKLVADIISNARDQAVDKAVSTEEGTAIKDAFRDIIKHYKTDKGAQERHYMTQPLVELYGGCVGVLKVS
jgi:hypothetical protein